VVTKAGLTVYIQEKDVHQM